MKALSIFVIALTSAVLAGTVYAANDKRNAERENDEAPKIVATLPPGTPAEQVEALIKQHEKALTAFRRLFEAAKTEEERAKLEPFYPDPDPYSTLLVEIAEKNAKDPAVVDGLVWAVRNGGKPSAKARAILIRDHLLNPKSGPLCPKLRDQYTNDGTLAILRRVFAENPGKEAQAQAAFALAKLLQSRAAWARILQKAKPNELAKSEEDLGKDVVAYLKRGDAAALEKETEDLLEKIRKERDFAETTIDFGDGRVKLGELAGRELFEIRHLQPGKLAPEIAGEDIDGKPMKLSDFRGKVVLLDFWGHW